MRRHAKGCSVPRVQSGFFIYHLFVQKAIFVVMMKLFTSMVGDETCKIQMSFSPQIMYTHPRKNNTIPRFFKDIMDSVTQVGNCSPNIPSEFFTLLLSEP